MTTEPRVTCPSCGYARGYHSDDCDAILIPVQFNDCDDCRAVYTGLPYYTFDPADCTEQLGDDRPEPHPNCTGNICPACAGPHLNPDHEGDPRRPVAQGA